MQIQACHASGKPVNARELLLAGVQDVMQMIASERCKINEVMLLMLETLCRSMGFTFATVCLKDPQSGQFRARISIGEDHVARQARLSFLPEPRATLFHLAMEKDVDLLIAESENANIRNLIPAWHRKLLPQTRSFVVLPLLVKNRPFGLIYADRALPAVEGVPPDETALVNTLKGQLLAYLNHR